uniref:C-type lectin domain-containing protein n=1 Tax=Caenorhabditis japonica TaxID=281687 RepID=A0A8R1EBE7_CAEJA
MSNMKRLILLLVSSSMMSAQSNEDASFIRFCDTQDGTYTPIGKGPKTASGNTCEVPFIHWAKTEKLRWEFCTEYLPHTVLATKVIDQYTYTCLVESRVTCDDGWIQLHGICHKLIYEAMTKPEARARCQKERANARIAVYHNLWMTRHWQDFFRDAIKLWVDATETITDRLIYKRGPELMFAHDTLEYGLHSGAFCSRRRVFEWVHGVARNSPNFDSHWASPSEPNMKGNEPCLELLKGRSTVWGGGRGRTRDMTMMFNDCRCTYVRYFFCGKEAELVVVPLASS